MSSGASEPVSTTTRVCRRLDADRLRRGDPVEDGHRDVHQDDVGPVVAGERDGLLAVRGAPDDGDPPVGREDRFERLGEEALVVGDQDSHLVPGHVCLRYSAWTRRQHARRSTTCC